MKIAVPYMRVSTVKQGRSGLGLEAQEPPITEYCRRNDFVLGPMFIEIRSTRKHRPRFYEAIRYCRDHNATLIVSTLDRLGRDVEEIAHVVKMGIDIIVVDNPHANRFTLHILAAVAEETRRKISEDTKKALAIRKSKGLPMGVACKALAERNRNLSRAFTQIMVPVFYELKLEGFSTYEAIAAELERRGIETFYPGCRWHPSTICKMMKAYDGLQ